jgi:hypothetical protein
MSDLISMNFVTFLQNYVKVSISGMLNFVKYLLIEERFTEIESKIII